MIGLRDYKKKEINPRKRYVKRGLNNVRKPFFYNLFLFHRFGNYIKHGLSGRKDLATNCF